MSRDELFALEDARFRKLMVRGWEIPFYRRLWGARLLRYSRHCSGVCRDRREANPDFQVDDQAILHLPTDLAGTF